MLFHWMKLYEFMISTSQNSQLAYERLGRPENHSHSGPSSFIILFLPLSHFLAYHRTLYLKSFAAKTTDEMLQMYTHNTLAVSMNKIVAK